MERSVALKKLRRVLGNTLGYRIDDRAPKPEERETARDALPAAIAERKRIAELRDARHRAILEADAEYQKLRAEYADADKQADKLSSITRRFKITVGTTSSMFFHVRAQGDTWEEIIGKLTAKEKQAV